MNPEKARASLRPGDVVAAPQEGEESPTWYRVVDVADRGAVLWGHKQGERFLTTRPLEDVEEYVAREKAVDFPLAYNSANSSVSSDLFPNDVQEESDDDPGHAQRVNAQLAKAEEEDLEEEEEA